MKKPLNRNLRIRLNEDEDKGLVVLAIALGEKTRSRVVRKMIREGIVQGPDLLKDDLNTFREAIRQVAALGRNMNQIARAIHSGQVNGITWDPALLNAAIQQNKALEQKLITVVMRSRNRWVCLWDQAIKNLTCEVTHA